MGSGTSTPLEDGEVSGKRKTSKRDLYPKQQEWKRNEIKQSKSNALLVAAIDFGTTYSGYAYSFITKPDNILATYWNGVSIKTPTVVLMNPEKTCHSFGDKARQEYEKLMKTDQHKHWHLFERFKMKLFVKGEPLNKDMEIEDILGKPMKAMDIFSGAIRYIREHLLNVLNDPNREDRLEVNPETDIRWVLTVPAIWNDLSKKFMREAAAKAGIPDHMLLLALEPEAASLYCRRELGTDIIPRGCRYLVLDLGGGTADITCHEVNIDDTLKELHPPTGGDFGGTTVDNAFINVLNRIFGADVIKQFKQQFMNEYWELMTGFERKKRTFNGNGRIILKFPIQVLELYKEQVGETVEESLLHTNFATTIEFKQGKIFMAESLAKEIFSQAFNGIVEKTNEVIAHVDNISCIILVGGFSESLFLQKVMKERFENVIFPQEPAAAVLKGAVIYGHETRAIASRKCRYTYGIAKMDRFDPTIHPEIKRIQIGDLVYCDDVFSKHIEVGTEVSLHNPEVFKEHEYYPSTANQRQAVLEVYKSKLKELTFIDDVGCEFVGLIKVDIDPNGDIWSKLKVKLIFGGTELDIEVTDVKNGTITKGSVDFMG